VSPQAATEMPEFLSVMVANDVEKQTETNGSEFIHKLKQHKLMLNDGENM
jgi:hypothetical protein